MSHIDTFDGKPDASPDIRGDLVTRPSRSLEGAVVSEHFARLDSLLGRCALVRSITHGEGNHDRGTHFLLTGHRPSPVLVYPSIGSTAAVRVPTRGTPLPGYVCVPDAPQYGGSGFLDQTLAPFEIAVGGRRAALTVFEFVAIHGQTHRAAGVAPLPAGALENLIYAFFFGLFLHLERTRYRDRGNAAGDSGPLNYFGGHPKVFNTTIGTRPNEDFINSDFFDRLTSFEIHVFKGTFNR